MTWMRLQDNLLFVIDEAVAINEVGYDKYYENVNTLVSMQLSINEAFINNEIDYEQFNQLMFEYTLKEEINIGGRKVKRMGGEFYQSIKEEFEKCVNSWKKGGLCGKGSSVGRVVGITTAAGVRIAGLIAMGPVDWALNGAAALVTIPLKDYDCPLTTPLYRTSTKPFIDEIRNRHTKKCESIVDTAKGLKERAIELRKKSESGELNPTQVENQINKLMKDILSLAKSIDREHDSIQKDIDKLADKMERRKQIRGGYTDGDDHYHKMKHDMENLKNLHDRLGTKPEDKYNSKSKTDVRDVVNKSQAEAVMTKYANKYRIKEQLNGSFDKKDCQYVINNMVRNSAPKEDIKVVKSYIRSL